jgi:hypothetical protein
MEQNSNSNSWLKSRTGLVFLGFAAIALFLLWEEHKAHLVGATFTSCCCFARSCICFMEDMGRTAEETGNIRTIAKRAFARFQGRDKWKNLPTDYGRLSSSTPQFS